METHFTVFVSIGNLGFILYLRFLFAGEERGRTGPPPLIEKDLSASG